MKHRGVGEDGSREREEARGVEAREEELVAEERITVEGLESGLGPRRVSIYTLSG